MYVCPSEWKTEEVNVPPSKTILRRESDPDPDSAYESADGDQTARSEESDGSLAASSAEIRQEGNRATYTSGEDGSDGEQVWVMAVRSCGQDGGSSQTAKVQKTIALKEKRIPCVVGFWFR